MRYLAKKRCVIKSGTHNGDKTLNECSTSTHCTLCDDQQILALPTYAMSERFTESWPTTDATFIHEAFYLSIPGAQLIAPT
jgi:hypothetical protein